MLSGCFLGTVLLLTARFAGADDEGTCFDGSEMEGRGRPRTEVTRAEVGTVEAEFEAVESYRACLSYASLRQGYVRGTVEYARPDRTSWKVRHRPHQGPATTLEVVRVGRDTWYRTGSDWMRLPAGRELAEALPGVFLPPEPVAVLRSFLAGRHSLVRIGESTARAGASVLWEDPAAPGGTRAAVAIGRTDHLPYRYLGGGAAIEAYLQLELYDFGAKLDIRPPS